MSSAMASTPRGTSARSQARHAVRSRRLRNVRYAPIPTEFNASQRNAALCQKRTYAVQKICILHDTDSKLHCRPGQPCALSGTDEEPVRLVRANAILVLPPAIACEDHNALRRIPHQFAHIEGESILSQVFSRPKVTRPERLARLATTFRPMHDHEAV